MTQWRHNGESTTCPLSFLVNDIIGLVIDKNWWLHNDINKQQYVKEFLSYSCLCQFGSVTWWYGRKEIKTKLMNYNRRHQWRYQTAKYKGIDAIPLSSLPLAKQYQSKYIKTTTQ